MNSNDVLASESKSNVQNSEVPEETKTEVVQEESEVPEEVKESPYDSLSSFEKEQYKLGWRPKELYKGDEKYWKTAELFAKDSDYFQEMNRQKKVIYELQQKERQHDQELKMVQKIAYDKAMEDLIKQRNEAIILGKNADADKYDAQLDQLKHQVTTSVSTAPPPLAPDAQAWIQKNSWITSPEVYNVALAIEADVVNKDARLANPINMVERFEKIAEELKGIPRFQHYFPQDTRKIEKEVRTPMVESTRQTKATKTTAEETYFDKLDRDQQDVVRRMVKASLVKTTEEEYAKKVFEYASAKGKSLKN